MTEHSEMRNGFQVEIKINYRILQTAFVTEVKVSSLWNTWVVIAQNQHF